MLVPGPNASLCLVEGSGRKPRGGWRERQRSVKPGTYLISPQSKLRRTVLSLKGQGHGSKERQKEGEQVGAGREVTHMRGPHGSAALTWTVECCG